MLCNLLNFCIKLDRKNAIIYQGVDGLWIVQNEISSKKIKTGLANKEDALQLAKKQGYQQINEIGPAIIYQKHNDDCGVAVLAMILKITYYEALTLYREIFPEKLNRELSLEKMKKILNFKIDTCTLGNAEGDWGYVPKNSAVRIPSDHKKPEGEGHLVFYGVNRYVRDPAKGFSRREHNKPPFEYLHIDYYRLLTKEELWEQELMRRRYDVLYKRRFENQ